MVITLLLMLIGLMLIGDIIGFFWIRAKLCKLNSVIVKQRGNLVKLVGVVEDELEARDDQILQLMKNLNTLSKNSIKASKSNELSSVALGLRVKAIDVEVGSHNEVLRSIMNNVKNANSCFRDLFAEVNASLDGLRKDVKLVTRREGATSNRTVLCWNVLHGIAQRREKIKLGRFNVKVRKERAVARKAKKKKK